jgi:hypothetical protein
LIRVGFVNLFAVREWLGGLNYLRNLLQAVTGLEGRQIEPVLFTGTATDASIASEFSFLPVVRTRALDRGHPLWILRKATQRLLGADRILERVLASHGVAILSHSGDLGHGAAIPGIGWVPDLQHRHLRELFSAGQFAQREAQISQALGACVRLIVSSETAAQDLRAGHPQHAGRIRVLRFVSGLLHGGVLPRAGELRARYAIDGPYFHLPNQFWTHKNHAVIIEALTRLKAAGRPVTVIATGLMEDPRRPQHVEQLRQKIARDGLEGLFRPLGVVPYRDMLGLMRHATAVINPSFFEGWSTSVEEAKSMGKAVVLSGIAVHREQAPERGLYFDPHDPEDAARALWEAWSVFDPGTDEDAVARAAAALPARLRQFAEGYQGIVLEALGAAHG